MLVNRCRFSSFKCGELQTLQHRQQETSRRVCDELSTAFTVKTLLIILEYIFQFLINSILINLWRSRQDIILNVVDSGLDSL